MGLFRKKEEKKVYLPTAENRDSESEAAKLKALEASLEFLNNPKVKEENNQKKADEEKTAEVSEEKREETPDDIQTEQEADTKAEKVQNTALTSTVKANPVAPAVQPPSGKTLNPNASNQNTEEKKPDTAPVPKQTEPAEEKPATSMASKQWGRRMDYKTAVVKPQSPTQEEQPPVKPLAPTSVSNVPPAPRMPSNSLHTLNSQNSQNRLAQQQAAQQPQAPAKTIVPTVPEVPGKNIKNEKPTVVTMNVPVPAQIDPAPTIVAANSDMSNLPQAEKTLPKEETMRSLKPAAELSAETPAETKKKPNTEESKLKPALHADDTTVSSVNGMQKAIPAAPVQKKRIAEEKGLKAGDTGMIPNPLPTPKKHIPKEMDFDIQPPASQMHFDIVDMTGMDFFDIN